MYYVAKTMEIAGAHSLHLSYESKCEKLHGHNWIITVYCKAKELNQDGILEKGILCDCIKFVCSSILLRTMDFRLSLEIFPTRI